MKKSPIHKQMTNSNNMYLNSKHVLRDFGKKFISCLKEVQMEINLKNSLLMTGL